MSEQRVVFQCDYCKGAIHGTDELLRYDCMGTVRHTLRLHDICLNSWKKLASTKCEVCFKELNFEDAGNKRLVIWRGKRYHLECMLQRRG